MQDSDRSRLLDLLKLPANTAAGARRLTEFQDGSTPRPGSDDLFFAAASDQAELEKPWTFRDPSPRYSGHHYGPKYDWTAWLFLGIVALACLGVLYIVYRIGRWIIHGLRG